MGVDLGHGNALERRRVPFGVAVLLDQGRTDTFVEVVPFENARMKYAPPPATVAPGVFVVELFTTYSAPAAAVAAGKAL